MCLYGAERDEGVCDRRLQGRQHLAARRHVGRREQLLAAIKAVAGGLYVFLIQASLAWRRLTDDAAALEATDATSDPVSAALRMHGMLGEAVAACCP